MGVWILMYEFSFPFPTTCRYVCTIHSLTKGHQVALGLVSIYISTYLHIYVCTIHTLSQTKRCHSLQTNDEMKTKLNECDGFDRTYHNYIERRMI